MKTSENFNRNFERVASSDSDIFSELVEISGLNRETDFRGARLQYVDLKNSNLRGFNFDQADLRGASWEGTLTEPLSTSHCLRGNGTDNVCGADFPHLAEICLSKQNWGERFLAFKLLVDNWGENTETADVLLKLLKADKGTYLRLCAHLYFCASYSKDKNMKLFCVEMAKAGRSQANIYRLNTLKKAIADYAKYFENVDFRRRYPGDIDSFIFENLQRAVEQIVGRSPDQRFL